MTQDVNVLVVDDHPAQRLALSAVLADLDDHGARRQGDGVRAKRGGEIRLRA